MNHGRMAVSANTGTLDSELLDVELGAANALKQKINLSFEGINLPNLDSGSKSDCFLVLYAIVGNRKTKIGETEVIADSLNPKWVKSMDVDYFFEAQQNFRLEIYDADDINNLLNLSLHDFVGRFDFQLSKIISGRDQELTALLTGMDKSLEKKGSKVRIMALEKKANFGNITSTFTIDCKLAGCKDILFLTLNKFK